MKTCVIVLIMVILASPKGLKGQIEIIDEIIIEATKNQWGPWVPNKSIRPGFHLAFSRQLSSRLSRQIFGAKANSTHLDLGYRFERVPFNRSTWEIHYLEMGYRAVLYWGKIGFSFRPALRYRVGEKLAFGDTDDLREAQLTLNLGIQYQLHPRYITVLEATAISSPIVELALGREKVPMRGGWYSIGLRYQLYPE